MALTRRRHAPDGADTARAGRRVKAGRRDARRRRRHGRPLLMFPVRIGLVGFMAAIVAILACRAFDQILPSLLIPPVAIAIAAMLLRRQRALVRLAAATALVICTTLVVGVIEGASVGTFADEAGAGPRRLFTTEWPSPLDPGVIIAIGFFVALVTAIATDLAGRPHLNLSPLAAIAAGFAGAMAMSAPVRPAWWALQALAAAAALFVLARPGDDPRARVRLLLSERSLAATMVGLVAAGVITSTAIAWDDRVDPRQDVEANLTLALLDPIEQTAALRAVDPPISMFSITDRSTVVGPTLPARWRTAALEQYDGQRWLPAITLRPIGQRLGLPAEDATDVPPPIRYELTVATDDIDLVPLPGAPLVVDVEGGTSIETDVDRTVVRLTQAPRPGLLIDVTAELPPTAGEVAAVSTRQVDDIATGFTDLATELAPDGTVLERLRAIESAMRSEGWRLNSHAAGAGQQQALIERFVNDTRTGTREQFVTAFVLLARSLGVNARVASGFVVPPDDLVTPLVLMSTHATVWPEVQVGELGWLAYDPVPPEETLEPDDDTPPPSEQSPAAAQPPIADPPERDEDAERPIEQPVEEPTEWGTVRVWAMRAGIAGGAILVPIVAVTSTILVLKWRRRRRRLIIADPARRIVGAWANATDSLVDAGLAIGAAWTDDHIAEQAAAVAPTLPHDMRRLASAATTMTFGATDRSVALVDDAVTTSRSVDHAIRADRTVWQRIRWRLSTRSLRRRTRSPIVA